MTLFCFDVDGTIDSDPQIFQTLASALQKAGCQVAVLTGIHDGGTAVTPEMVQAKKDYLKQIGFSAYDQLAVFPDGSDLPHLKADWLQKHGADAFVDNNRANLEAAQDICLCILPWQTRMGNKKD